MINKHVRKTNQDQQVVDLAPTQMSAAAREALRSYTPARIGLERTGVSLATRPLLDFQLAHARARDAVHAALDVRMMCDELRRDGLPVLALKSQAGDRVTYLRRPDLGRRLSEDSEAMLKPGDSLVSTISMAKGLILHGQLKGMVERGEDDSSPIRTAAVLTCVDAPQPQDAFRPAFCDRSHRIYRARDLRRDLLPVAVAPKSLPDLNRFIRFTQRPWVGTCFFGFEEPVENMPQYGLDYGRVTGMAALLLCSNLKPEEKERLLVNYIQIGIDLGGMIRAGHPGWSGWGGHGSGRKLPIVFAGILLGDDELANINHSFPKASFGEDEQTAYGHCWTGARVVFTGHSGIDEATGRGRDRVRKNAWGPYEHTPPSQWKQGQKTSEAYRRCCTSTGWGAQALALRLLHAERFWNHDPFFDYVDRWMYEDDSEFVKTIIKATGLDIDHDWSRQGACWEPFVNEMWSKHRTDSPAPTDGWKQQKNDSYYRAAVANPE